MNQNRIACLMNKYFIAASLDCKSFLVDLDNWYSLDCKSFLVDLDNRYEYKLKYSRDKKLLNH